MKGEFYKMDYEAWDEGTIELSLEQEAAYLRICHQMYRRRGPIPNSKRLLCVILRSGHTRAMALLSGLVNAGKISITEDGMLVNERVSRELAERDQVATKRRAAGYQGGTNSGAARRNPLNGHDTHEANASTETNQRREEKSIEEDAIASLSETSSDAPPKTRRKRHQYPPDFEAFWRGYPTDAIMSKVKAFEAWKRLDSDARSEVMTSLPAFRAYCSSKPDYRPVHAVRYITQHRSEGFVELAAKAADRVFVAKDTPQWEAWQRVKKVQPVLSTEHRKEGWWFPSEWPPGLS